MPSDFGNNGRVARQIYLKIVEPTFTGTLASVDLLNLIAMERNDELPLISHWWLVIIRGVSR